MTILRTHQRFTFLATTKEQAASWSSRNVTHLWNGGYHSRRWQESTQFLRSQPATNSMRVVITGLTSWKPKTLQTLLFTKPPPSSWKSATTVKSCFIWTLPAPTLSQAKSAKMNAGVLAASRMELFQRLFQLKCRRSEVQPKGTSKISFWFRLIIKAI